MRPRASKEPSSEPRTIVGRWLLALLLNEDGERRRLQPLLNDGKNYDEPGALFKTPILSALWGAADIFINFATRRTG